MLEILVVLTVFALLVQLLLPAIQSSREASRRLVCANNLRQIGLASQIHHNTHMHFSTGGWTSVWVGDPNRGYGKHQPGGWTYNLLPYLEHQQLHDMGAGLTDEDRRIAAAQMFATPVPVYSCPSRRDATPLRFNRTLFNALKPDVAGRSDYAACIGNLPPLDQRGPGPRTYEEAKEWVIGTDRLREWAGWRCNGVIYQRSTVRPRSVLDGMSRTYLAGEKFLAPKYYENGKSDGDDQGICIGFDRDNARSANPLHPPLRDADIDSAWLPDGDAMEVVTWNFGGPHTSVVNMLTCDGSVQPVAYDMDMSVFSAMGSRNGSEPLP